MNAQIGIRRNSVPSDFSATERFPQDSTLGIASALLSIPALLIVLYVSALLRDLLSGRGADPDSGFVPFVVVIIPVLFFIVPFFLRQRLQRKQLLAGKPVIGAFFSADALLWCTKQNFCHYVPKASLQTVHLVAVRSAMSPGATGTMIPDYLVLEGITFYVRIPGAAEYKLLDLVRYLRVWKPDLIIRIDPRLNWPSGV